MSIFKHDGLKEWGRFLELNTTCMRLRGSSDDSKLRALFADVPAELTQETLLYLLDYSIIIQSNTMLNFATEMGVFDITGVKNNLEIAVLIRDTMFKDKKEPNAGHLAILEQSASFFGEAFAIDSMSAVYDDDFAMVRASAKSFASGAEKLEAYTANLKLLMRFTNPQFLANPDIGNIGIRGVREQINNFRKGDPLEEHLAVLGQLHFDDYLSIAKVISEDPIGRSAFMGRQIDAGVVKSLPEMSPDFVFNLGYALQARPMNTLLAMVTLNESDFNRFVSCDGLNQYLTTNWIYEGNAQILKDQNFLDLHELFNKRLLAHPLFKSVFERDANLIKPRITSVTLALMLTRIQEKGVYVDLTKHEALKTFASSLKLLGQNPGNAAVVQDCHEAITSQLSRKALSLYKNMLDEDSWSKHMKPLDTADKAYQFRLVAVRMCSELHQENKQYTSTALSKIKPIQQHFGSTNGLDHKEALLALVETYDEETILDALKGYKAGIKPLIELGVLDRKHMSLLPAKDRGQMLEGALGL